MKKSSRMFWGQSNSGGLRHELQNWNEPGFLIAASLTALAALPANAATSSNPARQTVSQSERYDRLLETNRSFRQARMRKECGPITDPQLRQSCFDSFAQYEPAAANATSSRRVASSKSVRHTTPNVGSSTAPRHHQSRSGQ